MAAKQEREYMKLSIDGDYITITTPTETVRGIIATSIERLYFISMYNTYNDYIFKKAYIIDTNSFTEKVLGYSYRYGLFPFCSSIEDVIKLVKAVVDYNNRHVGGRFGCSLANNIELRKKLPIKFNFNL